MPDDVVKHIVLIEDNEADVYLLKLALRQSGIEHEMTQFHSGEDALRALCPEGNGKPEHPIPDLILLDLNIPRCDGFEVISTLRSDPRLGHVPLAVVTSSPYPGDKEKASAMGATTYIRKATQLDAFIEGVGTAVRKLLEEKAEPLRQSGSA